jgi:hypothetical protein
MCVAESGHQWCAYPDPACPSGYRYSDQSVGDGLSGQCVADDGVPDAGIDAPSLNCPNSAPVQNGQAADLVLGQPDFTSTLGNNPFLSGSSLKTSRGLYADVTRLWVSDQGNGRYLQWNSLPTVNAQAADIVIGQPDLMSQNTGGVTQSQLSGGGHVMRIGAKLLVSDGANNRVLIWNSIPTTSGQPADLVLGQPNFTSKMSGNGASNLENPNGIWTDGSKLIVADSANHRVLIWNSFPTTNAAPADIVLGAGAFDTSPITEPPTASSLRPAGVTVSDGKLYVADLGNHRVLVWNSIPTVNNTPADQVLGQSGFDTNSNNGGAPYPLVNAIGMKGPSDVLIDACGSMYVCDNFNGRVLIYTTVPTTNAAPADAVLGKPDLTSQPSASVPQSATWMHECAGLAIAGTSLYVADGNRVLRFALSR